MCSMKRWLTPNVVLAVLMAALLIVFVVVNVIHFGSYWSIKSFSWWMDSYNLSNGIAINLLSAYAFYLVIIYLFTGRRKRIIKSNLQKQYWGFKKSVIGHFLGAINGPHSPDHAEQLCDLRVFRDYFNPKGAAEQREHVRWYDVCNSVQSDKYLQHELINELSILRDEVSYVLSSIEIHDEKIFVFFKRLQRIIYRHENGQFETDDFKSFMQFFYEVFSGWSFITGYAEKDVIQSFIDDL